MKLFLDTANRELIAKWVETGLVDGVTTNPSLLAKEGGDIKAVLREICAIVEGPVSIEVVEKEPNAVLAQAREIAAFAPNVVVKIPFATAYLPVIKTVVKEKIKVNVTLVFTPLQALLVAKLGADYISPFVGRWDDIGVDGMQMVEDIIDICDVYEFKSKIIAASIRTLAHWKYAADLGVDVATVPPQLLDQATTHVLTERGIALFDADWQKLGKKSLFE